MRPVRPASSTGILRPIFAFFVLALGSLTLISKAPSSGQPETPAPPPLQVTVSVSVSNAGDGKLSYQWRSTDGTIVEVNAPSTTWTLPNGPGIHFA